MIMLLDKDFKKIQAFETEEALFQRLKEQETSKMEDNQAKENWKFTRYSHKLLAMFINEIQEKSFLHMAREACQKEQDIIVICKGDEKNPSFFLETPDLDVAKMQRDWCKLYCKAHNLHIVTE